MLIASSNVSKETGSMAPGASRRSNASISRNRIRRCFVLCDSDLLLFGSNFWLAVPFAWTFKRLYGKILGMMESLCEIEKRSAT